MIQRIKLNAPRACLFGVLLAALAGCNGGDDPAPSATTFETPATQIDDTKMPAEPVVGVVERVTGTDPQPTGAKNDQIELNAEKVKEPAPKAVTRFLETAPSTMDDPAFKSYTAFQYDLGNLVARLSGDSASFTGGNVMISPIQGWVRYPEKANDPSTAIDRYPVIVFLHGQHTDSLTEHSYQGYDYLAQDLAPHGYVVVSIDANSINKKGNDNASSLPRAQLVLGTLDRLRQINESGQVDKDGKPGPLDVLKGKLDFDRIGVMGHSRGGQGVSNAIMFNQTRSGVTEAQLRSALTARSFDFKTDFPDLAAAVIPSAGGVSASLDETKFKAALKQYNIYFAAGSGNAIVPPPYKFKGAFLLAQTDFGGNSGLSDVPIATLLPSCDGDMANLQGSSTYDRNRFGRTDDVAPRYQIMVNGTNHNYYNTQWHADDFYSGRGPNYCLSSNPDTIRLSAENQRRGSTFIINSFMRYHVGDERKFASWWSDLAQLPDDACPSGEGSCDERVLLTVQKDAGRRALIQRFEWADSLRRNLIGGAMTFSGFDATARCMMPSAANVGGNCTPTRLPGFEYGLGIYGTSQGLLSIADHAELAWSKSNASIVTDLKGLSGTGFDTLTFRAAVVWPMGQEVLVTLTDGAGKAATVTASDFSDALYNAPRKKADGIPLKDNPADKPYSDGQVKMLMNMVAIPLKAFEGIDLSSLNELKLVFPRESGKVALSDIELQNLGRDDRIKEIALTKPETDGGEPPQTADAANQGSLLISK